MAVDISLEVAGSEDGSTLTGPCAGPNGSVANETMVSLGFIYSPYAHGISGVFVWSALLLTCFQVSGSWMGGREGGREGGEERRNCTWVFD